MAWTGDAWWVGPSGEAIRARAEARGVEPAAAALELLEAREKWLQAIEEDPYRLGFVPSIWLVAWAMVDWPWCPEASARALAKRTGLDWPGWKARCREALGMKIPVRDLLVMGANRSGKTDFGAKSTQMWAAEMSGGMALFLAQQFQQSALTVQPRLWHYMPGEWKRKHMGDDWYVHYKDLKGFSDAQFQVPTGTKVVGKFYSQEPKDALIGCEAGWAWADELVPEEWVAELGRRLASRKGKMLLTFTPIEGYTPVVKGFLDGARVMRSSPAYLLPRDGGEQLPWVAVGLTREEWRARAAEVRAGRLPTVPASRPEDCLAWADGEAPAEPPEAAGRVFERAPRVALCMDPHKAVVWFQTSDNPYGDPSELISREMGTGAERVRKVLYGIATKSRSCKFAEYDENRHTVADAAVPALGINYCFLDPGGGRNDALTWIRTTPEGDYVYREWPGSYRVFGVGVPAPWAKTSGRRGGINDGERDEGAESFGFGFLRMKYEVARLEGWADWEKWARDVERGDLEDGRTPDEEEMEEWDEENGARERIAARWMDSRPAAQGRQMGMEVQTLLDLWNACGGWDWQTAPGGAIEEGEGMIQKALADGTLHVAESCRNVRFALATYTGKDGQKGAVKDWIDMLRWFYKLGLSLCGGVDPLEVGRVWGREAPGAAWVANRGRVMAGGGGRREVAVMSRRQGLPPEQNRMTMRAGGRVLAGGGQRGMRMKWR